VKASDVLASALARLRACPAPPRDAEADVSFLLRESWGLSRAALLARRDETVPAEIVSLFESRVARRLTGEPVQYIVGHAQFYRDTFLVTPKVLIPRPETEVLVEAAIERLRRLGTPRLLDLGTGSGCIALSVLRDLPTATAVALDASEEALDVARENANRLGLADRCTFVRADWNEIRIDSFARSFDAVLSNPPYVPASDVLPVEIARFEPALALNPPGRDPLRSYREILRVAPGLLATRRPDGAAAESESGVPSEVVSPAAPFISFEVGRGQAEEVRDLMVAAGFIHEATLQDLAAIPRVVIGRPA
jgi:release factor glutamine methyltransferase